MPNKCKVCHKPVPAEKECQCFCSTECQIWALSEPCQSIVCTCEG